MTQVSAGNLEYTIKPSLYNNKGRDSYPFQSHYSPVWGKARSHVVLYGAEQDGVKLNKMSCSAKVSHAFVNKMAREKKMHGGYASRTDVEGSFSVKGNAFKLKQYDGGRSSIHNSSDQEINFGPQMIEGIEKCVATVEGATLDDVEFGECKATIVNIKLYNYPSGGSISASGPTTSTNNQPEPTPVPEPVPDIVDVPSIFGENNDPNW